MPPGDRAAQCLPGPEESETLEALADLVVNRQAEFVIGPLSLEPAVKAVHAVSGSETILFVTNPSVRIVAGELCLPRSFRLTPNTYQVARPLGPWALKNAGSKVFIVGSDKTEDKETADFFAHGFERSGGQFVDRVEISKVRKEVQKTIEAIRKTNPDFIYACFGGDDAISFLKAFRAASPSLSQSVIGPESLTDYPHAIKRAGSSGLGIRTMGFVKDPVGLADQIKKKLGRTISSAARAAEGYDIAQAICKVLEKHPDEKQGTAEIVTSLEGIEINGPRGKVTFDKNHEPIVECFVRKWDKEENKLVSHTVEPLGEVKSIDFGCGRVGFPKRPDDTPVEEEDSGDIE